MSSLAWPSSKIRTRLGSDDRSPDRSPISSDPNTRFSEFLFPDDGPHVRGRSSAPVPDDAAAVAPSFKTDESHELLLVPVDRGVELCDDDALCIDLNPVSYDAPEKCAAADGPPPPPPLPPIGVLGCTGMGG